MTIEKIFSNSENPEEILYSVLMTEDEVKIFSKLEDQDFYDEQEGRKSKATQIRKVAPWVGGSLGGITGGIAGHKLARRFQKSKLKGASIGALAGAGLGAVLSHSLGKLNEKSVHKDSNRYLDRYSRASETDKKYLRQKYSKEEERRHQDLENMKMRNAIYHAGAFR